MKKFILTNKELDTIVSQYQLDNSTIVRSLRNKSLHILLSGATGFLGTHLVAYMLLDNRIEKIYSLVREKEKLFHNFIHYGIIKNNHFSKEFLNTLTLTNKQFLDNRNFNELYSTKIHEIIGNVVIENWNIKDELDIDLIIHCAAKISALDLLKHNQKENCDSTFYGIQLAKKFQCPFMLTSTLSVFVSSTQYHGIFKENDYLENSKGYIGGYAQSKYISEKLTQHYTSQILRYGLLTGSTFQGYMSDDSFLTLFKKWIAEHKIVPNNYEESFVDITPVDIAALITKELIFKGNYSLKDNIYHIANSKALSIKTIIEHLVDKNRVQYVSHDDFVLYLSEFKKIEQIFFYYAFYKKKAIEKYPQYFNIDLFQSTQCEYKKDRLNNLSLDYLKQVNEKWLNLYFGVKHG